MAEPDPRLLRLVRDLDATRRDLIAEKKRSGALRMQNEKLRRAVVLLRRASDDKSSPTPSQPP